MAYSATADGNLLNLSYERANADEFVAITFVVPERFFQIEFYEPIATPSRAQLPLRWPGDLAADRVSVVVQEPAGASAISVEPNLEIVTTGREGLRYRATELGVLDAGKPLPIVVRYTKLDGRPSAELMKPKAAEAPAAAPAVSGTSFPGGVRALRAGAWLALAAAPLFFWWVWRRRSPARPVTLPHGACTQCGKPQARGNRFCGSCGTKLS